MEDPLLSDIFAPGQVLNNTYEIIGVLGRGGTGEVYLARNQINDRTTAIKALNSKYSGNADYVELMKREDQMRNILHDAVVRYTECSRTDQGHVFLVMEYIEGPSLADVMTDRRLEDRDLLIIAHRVLEGLVATHDRGIVHRDLSPDNIILRDGSSERATIIDFGIAKDTSAGARTIVGNEFAGKYEYAAPEQLEGRADYRTDLYCLGASLLAAYRREIPFVGTTPAEIVRRKQEPLDTSDLRDPLKEFINRLTAPRASERPPNAAEALDLVGRMLKPGDADDRQKRPIDRKRRSRALPVLLIGAFAAVGAGLWLSGALDMIFPRSLPIASPYEFFAAYDPAGSAVLSGHAPDYETFRALAAAFNETAGQMPDIQDLTLAQGVPSENWPDLVVDLMSVASDLEHWELGLSDMTASLNGLATNRAVRQSIADKLEAWSRRSRISVDYAILAGPVQLTGKAVQAQLDGLTTCGPLHQLDGIETTYALGDSITITGDLAFAADSDRIQERLLPQIGDRTLRVETTTLNEDLCAIRAVLPNVSANNLTVSLSNGKTGQPALTGVFRTGDNPVVDILMPATVTEGSLWVMVVDNTGKVFHVLPNINHTGHAIDSLGIVENGVRRVRVLWSVADLLEDGKRLAIEVTDGDYGKSEVIAILSSMPLFDLRRPRDESVRSVAEALAEAVQGGEVDIIGVASQIIDARE